MPFEELLERAQGGDRAAYGELWRRYSPAVAGFARAKRSKDPDDLTSETFLSLFRGLDRFTGGESEFRGYLFTIARRRLVDELRSQSRRPTPLLWTEDGDLRTCESAEEHALSDLRVRDLRRMIDSLGPDQRDVLLLRLFGDLTIDQVALALGKSAGAVKALQRRGMDTLRRRLGTDLEAEAG
jgi:RNA polymerase sigma-70 factor (ECF subfamily)